MHEYAIAYDLYATARSAALDNHATSVRCIRVEIGKMAMANPEQVEFLFGVIAADDPLIRDARLSCEVVPPFSRCSCGYEGDEIFVCPRCGALPELLRGREITVKDIEIEVDER